MDLHLSPLAMMAVAFLIVGALFLATTQIRKAHRNSYQRALLALLTACAVGALVSLGINAPKEVADWLLAFAFALFVFHFAGFWRARTSAD